PADDNKYVSQASDREGSPGRVAFCDGRVRHRPGAAEIGRMKHSRGTVPCDEVYFAIVVDGEASTARGERAFVGQGWGHRVTRKFFPVLAIGRADQDEFPVHGIAERKTFLFGDADERVEEKLRPRARKFELPGVAAVMRLVNA